MWPFMVASRFVAVVDGTIQVEWVNEISYKSVQSPKSCDLVQQGWRLSLTSTTHLALHGHLHGPPPHGMILQTHTALTTGHRAISTATTVDYPTSWHHWQQTSCTVKFFFNLFLFLFLIFLFYRLSPQMALSTSWHYHDATTAIGRNCDKYVFIFITQY